MSSIRVRLIQFSASMALGLLTIHQVAFAAVINVPCNAPALVAALQTAETNGVKDTLNLADKCLYEFVTFNTSDVDGSNALPVIDTEVEIIGNQSILKRDPPPAS